MIISVGRNLTTLKKDRKSALIVLKCVNISLHRYPKKKERKKKEKKKIRRMLEIGPGINNQSCFFRLKVKRT